MPQRFCYKDSIITTNAQRGKVTSISSHRLSRSSQGLTTGLHPRLPLGGWSDQMAETLKLHRSLCAIRFNHNLKPRRLPNGENLHREYRIFWEQACGSPVSTGLPRTVKQSHTSPLGLSFPVHAGVDESTLHHCPALALSGSMTPERLGRK